MYGHGLVPRVVLRSAEQTSELVAWGIPETQAPVAMNSKFRTAEDIAERSEPGEGDTFHASIHIEESVDTMVEGPKYHRHAELLRTLKRRRLKAVHRVETAEQGAGLRALLGCLVLEVFAVGKELFVVFALKWDEQRRGGSFRLHFGHGGGYLVESFEAAAHTGEMGPLKCWGPKADGGGHCRDGNAAVILEFSASEEETQGEVRSRAGPGDTMKFSLWNDLGSSFGMCSHEYLRSVEARRIFDINTYEHCQKSFNGQQMGCCHLMRIYGHWNCSSCQQQVSLIKEGKRQRITYFCPECQPRRPSKTTERVPVQRRHRHEIKVTLKPCHCGLPPAVLQVRAGNYAASWDDRRPYLSCPRRRGSRYDDGGCGIPGPWDGTPAMLRRVVSATRENGRHFWRCAERPSRCSYRCWVNFTVPNVSSAGRWRKVGARSDSGGDMAPMVDTSTQDNPFTAISSDPETSSSEKGDRTDGYRDDKRCTGPPVMTAKAKRWSPPPPGTVDRSSSAPELAPQGPERQDYVKRFRGEVAGLRHCDTMPNEDDMRFTQALDEALRTAAAKQMSLVQRWYKTEAALGLPGDGATGRSMACYHIGRNPFLLIIKRYSM
eukprot:symbB.v1.2.000540.t1/scaffold19.1/size443072/4